MAKALIVIDMQLDFCPGGRLAVAGGDEIVAGVNDLMADFDAVVLTQDWHPHDHASFADNHPGAAAFSVVDMAYGPQVLWPAHCVIGTEGAGFHPALAADCADLVIRKGFRPQIDSYSAFYENDHRTPTGLAGYLRDRGMEDLAFVGLAHDFCVAWSAIDAAKLGFRATVIEDATRAIDLNGSREAAREDMRKAGVVLA
ncbi:MULTISPECIES: bifunctional nicotinamidase/pyrazinamidase [Paracoccus]|uniref:bifunctional nicotinamidase/pyrazinamidase n=1 Tax=Paracoccus TaxID=265 RepID=UPI001FB800B5|nr:MULTISPECIES: bifunctional nicotinamidase/pyrazinamidase [Paracoccus]MCJ1900040.1 bifunctional nicotinamidase/pyrazinamidase [Paracoccus versutus]MDF3905378.1 bifunctional nicotinamidase/pyrazinamidase [Paracoccus sp. AS002]